MSESFEPWVRRRPEFPAHLEKHVPLIGSLAEDYDALDPKYLKFTYGRCTGQPVPEDHGQDHYLPDPHTTRCVAIRWVLLMTLHKGLRIEVTDELITQIATLPMKPGTTLGQAINEFLGLPR